MPSTAQPHTPAAASPSTPQAAGSVWSQRVQRIASVWQGIEVWPQALALLGARAVLCQAFFLSGLTKLQDWEATLFLFEEEYHVPLLSPAWAAWMGTGGELVFSALLLAGLLTRPAAVGLFVVNAMAVISYPGLAAAALKDHHLWGMLAIGLAVFGAGRLSLDALLWRAVSGRWSVSR